MKKILNLGINLLLVITTIVYPIIWFFNSQSLILNFLPLGMSFLWLAKSFLDYKLKSLQWIFELGLSVILLLIEIFLSHNLMYWYPVLMNTIMLILFSSSLWQKQTLVEKIARLQTPDLPPQGVVYTRRVTQVWCGVFIFNIVITLSLIGLNQIKWWSIYTGIISYVIMGAVMTIEWLIRQQVKRSFNYE